MQSNIHATRMNTRRKALYHAKYHKSRGKWLTPLIILLAGLRPALRGEGESEDTSRSGKGLRPLHP